LQAYIKNEKIFARYEYPIGFVSTEKIFEEYSHLTKEELISVAIRAHPNRSVIILTYAEDTDLFMHLKLIGVKDVEIIRYIDRK
jgi:hypothetical protein